MNVTLSSACGIDSIEIYDTNNLASVSTTFKIYDALPSATIIDCPSCASGIGTYNY
jgi:hypothetical protein